MAGKAKPSKVQDVDMDSIVTTERHDQDVQHLDKRLCDLEARFGSNEKVAETLREAADSQVKMQNVHDEMLIKALKRNDAVKAALAEEIQASDRSEVNKLIRKFRGIIGGVIIALISIAGTLIVQNYIGDMGKRQEAPPAIEQPATRQPNRY
jgi:hypothetical protein